MLSISSDSICDICGDQYGTVCLPYLIPCGHTFCRSCLVNINDSNPKGAACALCRERFTLEQIALVRVDPADPLPKLSYDGFMPSDDTDSDFSDRARSPWNQETRIRDEARALELRVSKAASVKCTFEEVSTLRDDIQNWLLTEPKYKPNGKFPALRLSAALLRAILLNSLAYTEQQKTSKIVENGLLEKIKALEAQQVVLEADVRRQKQLYSEKSHECIQLQQEVERLRRATPGSTSGTRLHSSPFPGPASPSSPETPSAPSSVRGYATSPESTASTRLPPPRSATTAPTRVNPYAPTHLPSVSSSSNSSRSNSAASSASSSPSPQPAREFFTPSSSSVRQTSPSPSPVPYATRPTQQKSGLETLLARTAAQASVPRSMTAPLPPNGTPPPIRSQTRPRPIQTQRTQAYPKVWLPMIDDTEDTSSENTYTYSHLSRHPSMMRAPATPTPSSVRR